MKNVISENKIKEILAEKYQGGIETAPDRNLYRSINRDAYSRVGSVFYSLEGSPPKGYAIVIPEANTVYFYNHKGERFKDLIRTKVEELKEFYTF